MISCQCQWSSGIYNPACSEKWCPGVMFAGLISPHQLVRYNYPPQTVVNKLVTQIILPTADHSTIIKHYPSFFLFNPHCEAKANLVYLDVNPISQAVYIPQNPIHIHLYIYNSSNWGIKRYIYMVVRYISIWFFGILPSHRRFCFWVSVTRPAPPEWPDSETARVR